jgi:hypothetical protein
MQKSEGRIPDPLRRRDSAARGRMKAEIRNPKGRGHSIRVVKESSAELQERLLAQIADGAGLCVEVERRLSQNASPQLETLVKLYRVLVLKLCAESEGAPTLLKLANDLMRPVMEWARVEEKRKERELAEQKYRDQVELQKADREKERGGATGALTAETLAKIERELNLF